MLSQRIDETIGASDLSSARAAQLDRLADAILDNHWHTSDLPWDSLPLLPIPEGAGGRRLRKFVEFGKRATAVQLAGERVAVAAASTLLSYAQEHGLNAGLQRALAAVLNDEAMHAVVMTELAARLDEIYGGVHTTYEASPLFEAFMAEMRHLDPALVAMFMGSYEALVAIRSYNEEASYERPSILGEIAARMGQDDGRHAKVMRLAAQELLDLARARHAGNGEAPHTFVEPIRRFWPLLIKHEWLLVRADSRMVAQFERRSQDDAELGRRYFEACGLTEAELGYADLCTLTAVEASKCASSAASNSSGFSIIGE